MINDAPYVFSSEKHGISSHFPSCDHVQDPHSPVSATGVSRRRPVFLGGDPPGSSPRSPDLPRHRSQRRRSGSRSRSPAAGTGGMEGEREVIGGEREGMAGCSRPGTALPGSEEEPAGPPAPSTWLRARYMSGRKPRRGGKGRDGAPGEAPRAAQADSKAAALAAATARPPFPGHGARRPASPLRPAAANCSPWLKWTSKHVSLLECTSLDDLILHELTSKIQNK